MNKKGSWAKTIGTIAAIVTILGFLGVNEVWEIIPQIDIIPDQPNTPSVTPPSAIKDFDFSETSFSYLGPIRNSMYANSNNVLCYGVKNPTGKANGTFTLIGEWFLDDSVAPDYKYKNELNYSDLFEATRFNWNIIGNASKIRFRVGLGFNNTPLEKEIEFNLTNEPELYPYLKIEDDGSIWWDHDLIRELISKTNLCSKTERQQVEEVLSYVRESMNPPLETERKIYFDETNLPFKEAWGTKIGTSSEYSYVFASFMRSIGIPSKVNKIFIDDIDYYYVEVFLENEWVPVDVYNKDKDIGQCFQITEPLKKDLKYEHICIEGFDDYVAFNSIMANKEQFGSVRILYDVSNSYGKEMKTYCLQINQTFFAQDGNVVYSDVNYFLDEDLNATDTLQGDVYAGYFDFETYSIELAEFSSLC